MPAAPTAPRLLALATLGLSPALARAADDCGLSGGPVPDYSLEDVNPTSPTGGSPLTRDSGGRVQVLYFALPTCGHCQAQVEDLEALRIEQASSWADDVDLRIIALSGVEDSLFELTDRTSLPVLLDRPEAGVAAAYGAEKWYFYLVDRAGSLATLHYALNLDDAAEKQRLLDEIATLRAGGAL